MSMDLTKFEQHVHAVGTKTFNLIKWLTARDDVLKNLKDTSADNSIRYGQEIKRLIEEAKRQESLVDLTFARGQRLLLYRKHAHLEATLENLAYLWNTFVDNLHFLHSCFCGEENNFTKLHRILWSSHLYFENPIPKENSSSEIILQKQHILTEEKKNFGAVKYISTSSSHKESIDRVQENSILDVHLESLEDYAELSEKSQHKPHSEKNNLESTKFFSLSSEFAQVSKLFSGLDDNGVYTADCIDPQSEIEKSDLPAIDNSSCKSVTSERPGIKMSFQSSQKTEDDQVVPGSARKLSGDPMSVPSPFKKGSNEAYKNLAHFESSSFKMSESGLCEISEAKRRMLLDTSNGSNISSRSESPLSFSSSRSQTPTGTLTRADRSQELWKAIGSIDSFLMDKDIIEACKSTAGDLTCDVEDFAGAPNVSFTEFLQQYSELNDWLNQLHKVTQREVTSFSEKYLNQSYHEEILERSPRREFLNNYSRQLLLRYPNMAEQISSRMSRLNSQWAKLEQAIAPKHGKHDAETMTQDLECDLHSLRRWLNATESRLLSLTIKADWTTKELEERLLQHQTLQKEIESRNKIVNAVLKLSDTLEPHSQCKDSQKQVALGLERRWHGIWLQSLEWQYRLEEALTKQQVVDPRSFDLTRFSLPVLEESFFSHYGHDISDSGLIELDDDSLLFIGRREDYSESSPGAAYKSLDVASSQSSEALSLNIDESLDDFSKSLLLEEDLYLSDGSSSKNSTQPSSPSKSSGLLKPESPLGKRPFPGPRSGESSPAKKGSQSPSSSSGGLSPVAQESPLESFIVSRGYQLHSRESLLARDDLAALKLRKNLFDRSSGDSANISETESKMGDSPPVNNHGHIVYVVTSSDGEVDASAFPRLTSTDVKDIGYSSESQSNDEVEVMGHQIDMEYKFPGKCELASDGPLGEKISLPSTAVNPDYYYMTHVDVDSTDKTDNGDTTDSGAEKIVKQKLAKKNSLLNGYFKELNTESLKESLHQSDSFEASVNEVLSELEAGKVCDQLDDAWDEADGQLALNGFCEEKEKFCAYFPGGEDATMLPMHQYIEFSESDSAPESREKKSIKYLIEHAEDLVKPSSPQHSSKSFSPKKQQVAVVAHPSPSKQTQTDGCSAVESSCDASGEDNSDHEGAPKPSSACEDFSTATDDADETLFNSVASLGTARNASADDIRKKSSPHGSPVIDTARLRKQTGERKPHSRGGKKDRPWSVVGLQEYSMNKSKPESSLQQAVAASESAIDHLHFITDSDSPFHSRYQASTFPRDSYTTIFSKSQSGSEQQSTASRTPRRKISHTSPREDVTDPTYTLGLALGIDTTRVSETGSPTRMPFCQNENLSDRSPVKNGRSRRLRKRSSLEKPSSITGLSRSSATDSYDSAEAESESETTDDYLTAPMEAATSDGDDVHNISGSLSEHSAWDNYQALYPTASEDPGEEILNWEPQDELEFDDDFQISRQKRSLITAVIAPKRSKLLKFTKQGMPGDDSDSDLEDFHHILEQSELSLRMADQSLRKRRKDPMGTGLHPDPAKYEEIIVTYDTSKSCLNNVLSHLKSENISLQDIARVNAIMSQWDKLYTLASERLDQTTQLGAVRNRLTEMKGFIQQSEACLSYDRYNSSDDLKATIASLRERNETLVSYSVELKTMAIELKEFSLCHPVICLDKYHQEISSLQEAASLMTNRVSEHVDVLSNNWEVWMDYLDSQKELDALLAEDRERLHNMLCQREFGMHLTKKDVLRELETLQSNLSLYKSKLSVLQAIRGRLIKSSDSVAQRTLLAAMADFSNQLTVVSQRCKQVYRDLDEDDDLPLDHHTDLGKLAVFTATLHEAVKNTGDKRLPEGEQCIGSSSSVCLSKTCASWLRSLPVQVVALMLVAGLVCVLDPDIIDRLTNFTLTVSPELHYVNGPPTM